jgi:hypothetical protein
MKYFLLLAWVAFLSIPQTSLAQKREKPKEWAFKHAESEETNTFTEGQRMKIVWLLNGKKKSTKAKLSNIDKDTVSFVNRGEKLELAKKDIKKITVYPRSGRFWGTFLGITAIVLAVILLILAVIASLILALVYLLTLGSVQQSNEFPVLPVVGLLLVGLLTVFVVNSRKTIHYDPFGENWIMQTPPTHLNGSP